MRVFLVLMLALPTLLTGCIVEEVRARDGGVDDARVPDGSVISVPDRGPWSREWGVLDCGCDAEPVDAAPVDAEPVDAEPWDAPEAGRDMGDPVYAPGYDPRCGGVGVLPACIAALESVECVEYACPEYEPFEIIYVCMAGDWHYVDQTGHDCPGWNEPDAG
jgi:hypothetical protein